MIEPLSAPPLLSGLNDAEAELWRIHWAKARLPVETARIEKLREDLSHVTRATSLLGHWQKNPAWLARAPAGPAPLSFGGTASVSGATSAMRICFPLTLNSFWFGNVLSARRFPKFSSRTLIHELKATGGPEC